VDFSDLASKNELNNINKSLQEKINEILDFVSTELKNQNESNDTKYVNLTD